MNTKINGLEFDKNAIVEYLESEITREDCEAWHNAELTEHMQEILEISHAMTEYDFILQVWGMKDAQGKEEPLSFTLS